MREIKNFFRKLKLFYSRWNVIWYALNTKDKRIQAELRLTEMNLRKRIAIRKKLKTLDDKDNKIYDNITNQFPEGLHEGLFIVSKAIRKEVEEKNDMLDYYDKTELLNGIMGVFEKYIDSRVDLAKKIQEKNAGTDSNNIYSIKYELERALKTRYVKKSLA